MKKSLLYIASLLFLAMLFSTNANSQSLEIYSQELLENGSTTNPIVFHAGIKIQQISSEASK
jgi:hypothetical protein